MDSYVVQSQCAGTTKAGKQCQHRLVFLNGLCKQHGGVNPPELMKARIEAYKEKILKRHRRWKAKRLRAASK